MASARPMCSCTLHDGGCPSLAPAADDLCPACAEKCEPVEKRIAARVAKAKKAERKCEACAGAGCAACGHTGKSYV